MPAGPEPATPRYAALDGWRGLCASLVAFYHFRAVMGFPVNSHVATLRFVQNAYVFVDFFFVLSGFVIAASYRDRLIARDVRLRDFLALRFGRLYPLHFFTLGVMLALFVYLAVARHPWLQVTVGAAEFAPRSVAANLLMLQGLHATPGNTLNHPSWSISSEFFTYLTFGVLWTTLGRRTWIAALLAIVVAPIAILRLKGNIDVTYDWGFIRSLLGFALGAGVHALLRRPKVRALLAGLDRRSATLAEGLLVVATCWFVVAAGRSRFSIAAPFLFSVVVLLFSQERGLLADLLRRRPSTELGKLSYSIYLLHFPLQYILMCFAVWLGAEVGWTWLFLIPTGESGGHIALGATAWGGDVANLAMFAVLLGCSALTYRLIEAPGRSWVRARVGLTVVARGPKRRIRHPST